MGCVNSDGTLSFAAWDVPRHSPKPPTLEEIREIARQPIYRVRASLSEMRFAGMVDLEGERYPITEVGRARLDGPIG